jgi:hypothetical protein
VVVVGRLTGAVVVVVARLTGAVVVVVVRLTGAVVVVVVRLSGAVVVVVLLGVVVVVVVLFGVVVVVVLLGAVVVVVVVVFFGVVVVVVAGAAVVVVGAVAQAGAVMVSLSRVTAPLRASTRPVTETPVVTVIDVRATIVPRNIELVPSVAELPICQKTWQDWAPFTRLMLLADSVVRAEPAWKTKTESSLPPPLRVSVPVSFIDEAELYTPGLSVIPPRSAAIGDVGPSPAAAL